MGSIWHIVPYDPVTWSDNYSGPAEAKTSNLQLRFSYFVAALRSHWPDAEIYAPFGWSIPSDGADGDSSRLYGGFSGKGNQILTFGIYHDQSFLLLPHFVIWYRNYVPEQHRLYLFNENGFPDRLSITLKTSVKEVNSFLGL